LYLTPLAILLALVAVSLVTRKTSARAAFDQGEATLIRGEPAQAVTHFTRAIELQPGYAKAYGNRGLAYFEQGNFDAAIADFDEAIRLDPQLSGAYVNRAAWYIQRGRPDQAINDLTEAIRLEPDLVQAYVNRSFAFNAKGEYNRAIADCNEAIRLDPRVAEAYLNRARAYEKKGDRIRAEADHEEAMRISPDVTRKFRQENRPDEAEYELLVDLNHLLAYRLSRNDVTEALRNAKITIGSTNESVRPAAGSEETAGWVIRGIKAADAKAIEGVVLRVKDGSTVWMRDVATLRKRSTP
jgi:tetratricopeptide (TPR) repeat protein